MKENISNLITMFLIIFAIVCFSIYKENNNNKIKILTEENISLKIQVTLCEKEHN